MGNDTDIFEDLYSRYSGDVYRFAFWLCGNEDDAKDITSETFIRVWTAATDIRQETVKAFLFTITRNLHLQRIRRERKFTPLTEDVPETTQTEMERNEDRSELERTLTILDSLPEIDRTVMYMKARDELSYHEISQMTGLTIAAIKVKIFRIRQKLALTRSS
ncbi:MAG: RNA polymerase sigma factor [Bacteroidota bacterium]